MMGNLYYYTTLLSGVIGLVLAVLLIGLRICVTDGLQKYNQARWCLVGAFGVFGMMNLMEASLDGATGEGTGDFAGVRDDEPDGSVPGRSDRGRDGGLRGCSG